MFRKQLLVTMAGLMLASPAAFAHGDDGVALTQDGLKAINHNGGSSGHAPIGVMGDHMHNKGEYMLSIRQGRMDMGGNRIGDDRVSAATIATTVPNRFAGVAGQPPTLRVVPEDMTMDMTMFGGMYAPTNWLTLMGMAMWMKKDMDLTTFQGGTGTNVLGHFNTISSGWGDTKISGMVRLYDQGGDHVHLNVGFSLPTGSTKERDDALAPNGMTMKMRLPYGMQLGTGTYDFLPGITYTGFKDDWSWGAQYSARIPLEGENDQGYRWGQKHSVTAWSAYQWKPWMSTSLRVNAWTEGKIHGIDPNIVAPVQTADPDNYGGDVVEAVFGTNLLGKSGALKGHHLGFEVSVPLYQNLNGPQMERDWSATIGWQKAF